MLSSAIWTTVWVPLLEDHQKELPLAEHLTTDIETQDVESWTRDLVAPSTSKKLIRFRTALQRCESATDCRESFFQQVKGKNLRESFCQAHSEEDHAPDFRANEKVLNKQPSTKSKFGLLIPTVEEGSHIHVSQHLHHHLSFLLSSLLPSAVILWLLISTITELLSQFGFVIIIIIIIIIKIYHIYNIPIETPKNPWQNPMNGGFSHGNS